MEQKKASKPQTNQSPLISILKFTPLFLFAGLVLFLKFDLLLAAPIASFAAIVIYMFSSKISYGMSYQACNA